MGVTRSRSRSRSSRLEVGRLVFKGSDKHVTCMAVAWLCPSYKSSYGQHTGDGHGVVLTVRYLQTLKCRFHIIFLVSCTTTALVLLSKNLQI